MSKRKRILIVDDDPGITRFIQLNLEQTGDYVVRTENQSAHALAAAEEFDPDLILLDVIMPEPDGGQVAAQLRSCRKLNGVPILFLTAAATKGEVSSRAGMIGGYPFIAKPVGLAELIDRIEESIAVSSR